MTRNAGKEWMLGGALAIGLLFIPSQVTAHGGVVEEDDQCIINIGYFRAHFKIYLPRLSGHKQYCEDLPRPGESVFVMEYLHDGLGTVPIDFRIIRNETGLGRFAEWRDVEAQGNLAQSTVFYQPPTISPGVFTALYHFQEPGEFIGIVTAVAPDGGKVYRAVFPFTAGYTGLGAWPWLVALLVLLQLGYWHMNGRFANRAAAAALTLGMVLPAVAGEPASHVSSAGKFALTYQSRLQPIVINRMHSWRVHVTDNRGEPVEGASLQIDGGMPEHDHGLPTIPRMTRELGGGDYLIEGLRFHMPGFWELKIQIQAGTVRDVVTVQLQL